jgi:uncharacterized protein YjiS (DUF1127 family)
MAQRVRTTITILPDVLDEISTRAHEQRMSVSRMIETLVTSESFVRGGRQGRDDRMAAKALRDAGLSEKDVRRVVIPRKSRAKRVGKCMHRIPESSHCRVCDG